MKDIKTILESSVEREEKTKIISEILDYCDKNDFTKTIALIYDVIARLRSGRGGKDTKVLYALMEVIDKTYNGGKTI